MLEHLDFTGRYHELAIDKVMDNDPVQCNLDSHQLLPCFF